MIIVAEDLHLVHRVRIHRHGIARVTSGAEHRDAAATIEHFDPQIAGGARAEREEHQGVGSTVELIPDILELRHC
jgi:hypothetical protein